MTHEFTCDCGCGNTIEVLADIGEKLFVQTGGEIYLSHEDALKLGMLLINSSSSELDDSPR